tara:strand:- start:349 stop:591 length:243 start_codon:yes stop_codon:yes gene_type:complete
MHCLETIIAMNKPKVKLTKCESCNGNGFVESNDENLNDEIQKCDDCNKFESDKQAQKMYNESKWLNGIESWTKEGYSGDY